MEATPPGEVTRRASPPGKTLHEWLPSDIANTRSIMDRGMIPDFSASETQVGI